jgi:peptide/nickel transport system permease protein
MLPTMALIVLTTFILLRLAPGDIVQVLAGEAGGGNPEYLDELRKSFGLDQPMPIQFGKYVVQLLHLNLGYSFRFHVPVSELIGGRLAATLLLMSVGLVLAIVLGIPAGVAAARFEGGIVDRLVSSTSLLIYATPSFLLGIMLIVTGSTAGPPAWRASYAISSCRHSRSVSSTVPSMPGSCGT